MTDKEFEDVLKVVMKASIIVFVLMFASRLLGYGFNIIVAKRYSEDVYGAFTLLWSVAGLSTSILLLGLPWGAGRFIAYYRGRDESENVSDTLKTSMILTVVAIIIAALVVYSVLTVFSDFFSVTKEIALATTGLSIGFSLFTYFYSVLVGFRKPEVSGFMEFTAKIVSIILLIAGVAYGLSLFGVVGALAVSYLLAGLISFYYCARKYKFGRFKGALGRTVLAFGIPVMISNMTHGILTWADVFMIRAFRSLSEVGIYHAANLMSTAGLLLFGSVMMILTPTITEYFGQKKLDEMSRLTSYILESFLVLFTPIFLVFFAFPREILVLFFKAEYGAGAGAFRILVVTMFLYGLIQIFKTILHASGKPRIEMIIVLVAAVVNVFLNLFLIKRYGIVGAAVATVAANTIILVFTYYYSMRIIRLNYSKKRVVKVAFACVVALFATTQIKTLVENPYVSLVASAAALTVSYTIVLFLLKSFRSEDVFAVEAVLQKVKAPERIREVVGGLMKSAVPKYLT